MEIKMTGRVALVANEKGGVGKSVFTRTLVDWLRVKNHRVSAYDADGTIGATVRILGLKDEKGALIKAQDPALGVRCYNGRADGERNILLDSIESNDRLYVHDLAGGLLTDLSKIVDDGDGLTALLKAFDKYGYRLTVFHVISPDIGSTLSVGRWLEMTGDQVDHVAVINLKHGKPDGDFPYWFGFTAAKGGSKGGKVRERFLARGGQEILFSALHSGTFAKLDAENVRFSVADDAGLLTISERAHVDKFWRDFGEAIKPAFPLLGIETAR
jgi:hypothetical protein